MEVTAKTRFERDPEVVGKVIDGEAIIINLATGMYYSADEVGALIWALLEGGQSLDEVAANIAAQYVVSADTARADAERVIQRLLEEGLMKVADRGPEPSTAAAAGAQERRPYVSPSLEVDRDMKDLLALDPPMPTLKRNLWEPS
jgi:hypothetical protein